MKNQNKDNKRCCNNKFSIWDKALNRKILKLNSKWTIIYNKRNRKYRFVRRQVRRHVGLDEYVFYSILNTDIAMELGIAASVIARSILALYNELVADRAKNPYVAQWQKSGEDIIVLRGFDHKHIKYLENEAKFTALGKHAIYHRWYHNRIMLVLSVFGRREEIEDIFDGLPRLR
ncbi:uncharacterized protein LOC143903309 [Temnothorax americanus]|uniref:uncharacterized protein LOC143903309 n=1 Tax=Temnothorax americanus TaxID=1964332 RepID=UPI0040692047